MKYSSFHLGAFKASRQRETKQQEAGKFRSIRDRVQSIKFRVEDFKKGTWSPMLTKGLNFQTSELIPSYNVEYQQKQKDGTYKVFVTEQSWKLQTQLVYDKKRMCAIFPVELKPEISNSQSIIAYYPGVRSFLTGFDGEKFIDIGNQDITRVFRYGQHIDKLISTKTTLKGRENKHKRQGLGIAK